MTMYLTDIVNRLTGFVSGMQKSPELWTKEGETVEAVQAVITDLNTSNKAVEDAKDLLSTAHADARKIQVSATKFADLLENSVIAYEKSDPDKLSRYGISLRKVKTSKPAPTSIIHPSLRDDTDGIGFIVSCNADSNAEQYEWYKGNNSDASKTDIIPEMKLYKTTTKTSFVDDEVLKGVRYFYKVRAINPAGEGPWSEAVSRVQ